MTLRTDGSVLVGPNAVPALAREGYRWRDIVGADVKDALGWPGTLRVMRKHWRFGAREIAGSLSRRLLLRDARRHIPELQLDDLVRAPAGVRAQAVDRDGALVDDFRLSEGGNVVWVRNAPSPAATSSMAIAEELVERLRL
jgi:L-2-hydroxyglutarate oxidase LhgO